MADRIPRYEKDYEDLATAVEAGEYDVVGSAPVVRGRPRAGIERVEARVTSVRIPVTTLQALESLAAEDHTTVSQTLRTAVDEYLARRRTAHR